MPARGNRTAMCHHTQQQAGQPGRAGGSTKCRRTFPTGAVVCWGYGARVPTSVAPRDRPPRNAVSCSPSPSFLCCRLDTPHRRVVGWKRRTLWWWSYSETSLTRPPDGEGKDISLIVLESWICETLSQFVTARYPHVHAWLQKASVLTRKLKRHHKKKTFFPPWNSPCWEVLLYATSSGYRAHATKTTQIPSPPPPPFLAVQIMFCVMTSAKYTMAQRCLHVHVHVCTQQTMTSNVGGL